ncbi:MAG: hypothetical protein P4L53_12245 [Candidatus Obscuribacterales bacterium]|nr:hypothetical protein [Candidatus Obscuribacterales bacterium]
MTKPLKILAITAATISIAALAFCILGAVMIGVGLSEESGAKQKSEILSPGGKVTAIVTNISADALSCDTVTIDIKSNTSGEEKHVGDFYGVDGLDVAWSKNNTLSIKYWNARNAKFSDRYIDVNKENITVDVIPGIKGAQP